MNDGVIYVLLGMSIISIVIAVISLVLILRVIKEQKEIIKICKTKTMENHGSAAQVKSNRDNVIQTSNQDDKKYGIIICKKCYAAISETSVVCSVCKMPVGRR